MNKLLKRLKELENKIPFGEKTAPNISSASVGWHIEHTLLATNKIIQSLVHSNPSEYKWEFNIKRIYVFAINKIPRGKGKAPASVQPQDEFAEEECKKNMLTAINNAKDLSQLNPHHYFEHPYFGKLHKASAIRFLNIHTQHHLNIINDIIKT